MIEDLIAIASFLCNATNNNNKIIWLISLILSRPPCKIDWHTGTSLKQMMIATVKKRNWSTSVPSTTTSTKKTPEIEK